MRTLLLVCLAVPSFAQPIQSPSPPRNRAKQEQTSNKETQAPEPSPQRPPSPGTATASGVDQQAAGNKNSKTKRETNQIWEEAFAPKTWSNWALFGAACIAAYIALKTLRAIGNQAEIARLGVEATRVAAEATTVSASATKQAADAAVESNALTRESNKESHRSNIATEILMKESAGAATVAAQAAKASADALVNAERAWVVISDIDSPKLNRQPGQTEFRFTLTNHGRTVARLTGPFRYRFEVVPAGSGLAETPDYGNGLDVFGERSKAIYGRIMVPGESNRPIDFGWWQEIGEEIFGAIEERRSSLYLYASLKYFDFAETERDLQFCYMYLPKTEVGAERWVLSGPREYNKHT